MELYFMSKYPKFNIFKMDLMDMQTFSQNYSALYILPDCIRNHQIEFENIWFKNSSCTVLVIYLYESGYFRDKGHFFGGVWLRKITRTLGAIPCFSCRIHRPTSPPICFNKGGNLFVMLTLGYIKLMLDASSLKV